MVYFDKLIDDIEQLDKDIVIISDNKNMSLELKNEWKITVINTVMANAQQYINAVNDVIDAIPLAEPFTDGDILDKKPKK